MKGKKLILAACFAISILYISCNSGGDDASQSSKGLYFFTNLDQYLGFVNLNSLIIKMPNAHSGGYVNLIDTVSRCGFTFNRVKQNIADKKLRDVEVSCWLYADEENPDCSIVCSADTGSTIYYYEASRVAKELNDVKEWIKVSVTFEFPDTLPDFASIKIYTYNSSKKPIYMDDLSIQFSEK